MKRKCSDFVCFHFRNGLSLLVQLCSTYIWSSSVTITKWFLGETTATGLSKNISLVYCKRNKLAVRCMYTA